MQRDVPRITPAEGGGSLMVAWRLEGRDALVIGGGAIAAGRVRLCLEAGARVRIVAPTLNVELHRRHARGEVTWAPRAFASSDVDGAALVLTAIDDVDASTEIARLARARGIPVNAADLPDLCDFWFPSVHRDGPIQIAVSTNGQGPALARRIKDHLVASLPRGVARATERFGVFRHRLRAVDPRPLGSERRMGFVAQIGRAWSWEGLAALDDARIADIVSTYLEGAAPPPDPDAERPGGRVRLVGVGPGDPTLLTERALRALEEAELVLADRLVSPEILALAHGEVRVAAKEPGRADDAQATLNAWMLEGARAGRDVVRLKCGDPFVFGRGGEERDLLVAHGVPVEVVPGISAALAAPLAAGIPVTHRDAADRLLVLTGHGRAGREVDLPAFEPGTTLVWLMAMGRLGRLTEGLIALGFPADWPVAIVQHGASAAQRATRGTLRDIAARAEDLGLGAPAVVVMGRVVNLAPADAFCAEPVREPLPLRASA